MAIDAQSSQNTKLFLFGIGGPHQYIGRKQKYSKFCAWILCPNGKGRVYLNFLSQLALGIISVSVKMFRLSREADLGEFLQCKTNMLEIKAQREISDFYQWTFSRGKRKKSAQSHNNVYVHLKIMSYATFVHLKIAWKCLGLLFPIYASLVPL